MFYPWGESKTRGIIHTNSAICHLNRFLRRLTKLIPAKSAICSICRILSPVTIVTLMYGCGCTDPCCLAIRTIDIAPGWEGCWSLRRLCHRSVSHTLSKEKSRMELNNEHIRAWDHGWQWHSMHSWLAYSTCLLNRHTLLANMADRSRPRLCIPRETYWLIIYMCDLWPKVFREKMPSCRSIQARAGYSEVNTSFCTEIELAVTMEGTPVQ